MSNTARNKTSQLVLSLLVFCSCIQTLPLFAADTIPVSTSSAANNKDKADEEEHRLVIQISSDDLRAQKTALSNIVNVQKYFGMDNVTIELVAFGPGYRMLTAHSPLASRISSLVMQDVTFTACMNTLLSVKEKTGRMPRLAEGVTVTRAGVPHIMKLQEQGYSYIKY